VINYIFLTIIVVFFAMNMGASGVAPSFAASYGARLISRKNSILLFGAFVILGAVISGRSVSITLGKGLIPQELISFKAVSIILLAATMSLFLANILKVPQSTSQVTVGAVVGVGLYLKHLSTKMLFVKILPMWLALPLASYILTYFLYRMVYPPERDNLHIYQAFFANQRKLKISSLAASCYVAFAIGSNNVANAVGPLFGAGIIGIGPGLLAISPLFCIGAWLLGKGPTESAAREIIPLGMASSTLVSFVTATLLLIASVLGIPQSLVQLNLTSIFAVSCVKDGHRHTMDKHLTRKTFIIWAITPIISIVIAFLLSTIFLKV